MTKDRLAALKAVRTGTRSLGPGGDRAFLRVVGLALMNVRHCLTARAAVAERQPLECFYAIMRLK